MTPTHAAIRHSMAWATVLAAFLPTPAGAAEYCCVCTNGRQETVTASEADAHQSCTDICVRQSIMDQKVAAESVAPGGCEAATPGSRSTREPLRPVGSVRAGDDDRSLRGTGDASPPPWQGIAGTGHGP